MKFWYAINTKPHSEIFAAGSLQQLGVEVFLPKLKEARLVRGTWQKSIMPLFPGYLFAHFDLANHFRAVTYAKGVRKIVALAGGPSIVDEPIIHAIRAKVVNEAIELPDRIFSPGEVVKIQEGPLCGLEAVFQKRLNGASRAVLLLKAMSYQARLIIDSQLVANL
jgi:transcriptional antiterminator RfaH